MMVVSTQLTESLQTLVDARLDTIERMLLGRVPRQDRLAIVREVEGQIHDLIQQREGDELDRDDILAVLARLDPPEAYLPEQSGSQLARAPGALPVRPSRPTQDGSPRVARASGILGLCSLLLVFLSPLGFFAGELLESEIFVIAGLFLTAGIACVTAVLGIALACYGRLRGVWAILGLVCGIIAVLASLLGALFLLFMLG